MNRKFGLQSFRDLPPSPQSAPSPSTSRQQARAVISSPSAAATMAAGTLPIGNGGIEQTDRFPYRLHQMLEDAPNKGFDHIVSWLPDTRGHFMIYMPKLFQERVQQEYFGSRKYKSFQRQLNLYGFTRKSRSKHEGEYWHPFFLESKPELLQFVTRAKPGGASTPAASSMTVGTAGTGQTSNTNQSASSRNSLTGSSNTNNAMGIAYSPFIPEEGTDNMVVEDESNADSRLEFMSLESMDIRLPSARFADDSLIAATSNAFKKKDPFVTQEQLSILSSSASTGSTLPANSNSHIHGTDFARNVSTNAPSSSDFLQPSTTNLWDQQSKPQQHQQLSQMEVQQQQQQQQYNIATSSMKSIKPSSTRGGGMMISSVMAGDLSSLSPHYLRAATATKNSTENYSTASEATGRSTQQQQQHQQQDLHDSLYTKVGQSMAVTESPDIIQEIIDTFSASESSNLDHTRDGTI